MSEQANTPTPLRVRYVHERPGAWHGNILWPGKYDSKWGTYPKDHPCAAGSECFGKAGDAQSGESDTLTAFRERGYWASCFPEGDGITMSCKQDQSPERVARDIQEVFGWRVEIVKQ